MRILVIGKFARGWWNYRVPWVVDHDAIQADVIVDNNTLEYLSGYDLLLLYGHDYRDRMKGERILMEFVRRGGSILVDTVNSPDSDKTFLGVKSYTTETSGPLNIKVLEDVPKFSSIDFKAFSPADYGGKPWRHTAYKNVQTPILAVDDKIVLGVKKIGGGRVVYLGFNFFYHAYHHRNYEETRFLSRVVEWAPTA